MVEGQVDPMILASSLPMIIIIIIVIHSNDKKIKTLMIIIITVRVMLGALFLKIILNFFF